MLYICLPPPNLAMANKLSTGKRRPAKILEALRHSACYSEYSRPRSPPHFSSLCRNGGVPRSKPSAPACGSAGMVLRRLSAPSAPMRWLRGSRSTITLPWEDGSFCSSLQEGTLPFIGGIYRWDLVANASHDSLTVLAGILFYFVVPDSPATAWFLTAEEKVMAIERLRENNQGVGSKRFKRYQFIEAFTDPQTWFIAIFVIISSIVSCCQYTLNGETFLNTL